MNPVIGEDRVEAFERDHSISLPSEYRGFLIQIGNGGAGPFYGVFSLGTADDNFNVRDWKVNDNLVGDPSKPFRFEEAWDDTSNMPPDDLFEKNEKEYWQHMGAFERTYWSSELMDGAIPICHQGCALRIWLVVTGPQSGKLWDDRRSEYKGIRPLELADGSMATFGAWYDEWLNQRLAAAGRK
ncbi:MAG: hypothetical protein ABR987_20415 [Terracidiphilus sp.]